MYASFTGKNAKAILTKKCNMTNDGFFNENNQSSMEKSELSQMRAIGSAILSIRNSHDKVQATNPTVRKSGGESTFDNRYSIDYVVEENIEKIN